MFPWLFTVYGDAVMKEMKSWMGRMGVRFLENGREWELSGLLYTDDLVLYRESAEDLKAVVGRSVDGNETLKLTRRHKCWLTQIYERLVGWRVFCGQPTTKWV